MVARSSAVVPRAICVGWGVNRESVRCSQFAAALDPENDRGSSVVRARTGFRSEPSDKGPVVVKRLTNEDDAVRRA